jgi:hypothetical protein
MKVLFAAVMCALGIGAVNATTVQPPTFAELVDRAETIVRGVVTDVRTEEFDSTQGRGIRTVVTFHVERTLKGESGDSVSLRQLGGTVAGRTLQIVGLPQFKVGDRRILFVADNGRAFSPFVALGHGVYRLRTDAATGREYVTRDNGTPLGSIDEIALPLEGAALVARLKTPGAALSPAAFEQQIAAVAAQLALAHQQP